MLNVPSSIGFCHHNFQVVAGSAGGGFIAISPASISPIINTPVIY
jgi:hypothetical protein